MSGVPLEKKFKVLCEIVRAQHFAWREAVRQMAPDVDPAKVADRMWEITGTQTGPAYVKHIDPKRPVALQVAQSIAWSSVCMGEDAIVEEQDGEAFLRHRDCPWFHWHKRLDLLAEDRPGCDAWFRTTLETVNEELGTRVRFETLEALPDGGSCCKRRFWIEPEHSETATEAETPA